MEKKKSAEDAFKEIFLILYPGFRNSEQGPGTYPSIDYVSDDGSIVVEFGNLNTKNGVFEFVPQRGVVSAISRRIDEIFRKHEKCEELWLVPFPSARDTVINQGIRIFRIKNLEYHQSFSELAYQTKLTIEKVDRLQQQNQELLNELKILGNLFESFKKSNGGA